MSPSWDETTGRLPDQYLPQGVIDLQGDLEQAVTDASQSATAAKASETNAASSAAAAQQAVDGLDSAFQPDINVYNASLAVPPYDDLNTVPFNRSVLYSYITNVKNLPEGVRAEAFISLGYNKNWTIQYYLGLNGTNWSRTCIKGNFSKWTEIGKPELDENDYESFIPASLFGTIGVIGDSFSSGYIFLDSSNRVTRYEMSWPQVLARKNGIKAINFSSGGLTAKTWLSDKNGLQKLQSEEPCDLYIVVLGINDSYTSFAVGSISDVNDDNPEENADTFYGNMARILKSIMAKSERSKIICSLICSSKIDSHDAYDQAIKDLSDRYGIPVIDPFDDKFFQSSYYYSNKVGGHPTGPMYAGMASAFERLISRCIVDNNGYFKDYGYYTI